MKLIPFIAQDHYSMISEWWTVQKWPIIPLKVLPKTGLIVRSNEGTGICAGWIYKTDSTMMMMEWIIANPAIPFSLRDQGLDLLLDGIAAEARAAGPDTQVLTTVQHPRLIERYKKHGWILTDTGMTNFIKRMD